jgi:hypothetical protein
MAGRQLLDHRAAENRGIGLPCARPLRNEELT